MLEACELAQNNLRSVQSKMKERYNKYTYSRYFQTGDQVLALLLVPGKPLQARYSGPYIVKEKIGDLNHIVSTTDKRKNTQVCHINMFKSYVNRDKNIVVQCANIVSPVPQNCDNVYDTQNSQDFENKIPGLSRLQNLDILCNLDSRLEHLEDSIKARTQRTYI